MRHNVTTGDAIPSCYMGIVTPVSQRVAACHWTHTGACIPGGIYVALKTKAQASMLALPSNHKYMLSQQIFSCYRHPAAIINPTTSFTTFPYSKYGNTAHSACICHIRDGPNQGIWSEPPHFLALAQLAFWILIVRPANSAQTGRQAKQ